MTNLGRLCAVVLCGSLLGAGCKEHGKTPPAATYQGVVEFQEVPLGFEMPGRLRTVHAVRGAQVEAGQKLASLDTTLAELTREAKALEAEAQGAQASLVEAGTRPEEVRALEAELTAARAQEDTLARNLGRQQRLLDEGAVPPASVDELSSSLAKAKGQRGSLEQRLEELRRGPRGQEKQAASARARAAVAAVRLADAQLERHHLFAPLAGTVLEVHHEPGEMVAAGEPMVTVADTTHPYADVFVPQGQLGGVTLGAAASVRVDAEGQPFVGQVEDMGRRAEFTPRYLFSERERPNLVYRVRVRIFDPGQKLHAGVPSEVSFGGPEATGR